MDMLTKAFLLMLVNKFFQTHSLVAHTCLFNARTIQLKDSDGAKTSQILF